MSHPKIQWGTAVVDLNRYPALDLAVESDFSLILENKSL